MKTSEYIIKVSGCFQRGEYEGGKTIKAARFAAREIAKDCLGRVAIVKFRFGPDDPEDGFCQLIEVVQE